MHNRVRMLVASFLTKDFADGLAGGIRLVPAATADHDTANDVGGWQ